jgi:hypothetical protein
MSVSLLATLSRCPCCVVLSAPNIIENCDTVRLKDLDNLGPTNTDSIGNEL